ncbi:MAG: hypothetical protein GY814_05150, partial [Gammaproteobacteria bacterium]|nr:hypothetical protein [Gammaproteobacteria bacterium]
MDIKYVGNGGDFTEFEEWATYFKAIGTLTEDVICYLTDSRDYPITDITCGDFSALNFGPYQLLITSTSDGFHGGAWDNGAIITRNGSGTIINVAGTGSPEQYLITDVAFRNYAANGKGPSPLAAVTISRCLSTVEGVSGFKSYGYYTFTANGKCKMDACAARSIGSANDSVGLYLNQWHAGNGAEIRGFSAIGFATGLETNGNQAVVTTKNVVTYNCTTGFDDGTVQGWGDASNNASDDGTHPGDDGVLITADPFEADGYTPSQGGQLDAAGVDVGVILGADGKPFALMPAIGAYPTYIPSDSVAPILTNPTSEGSYNGLLCTVDTDEAYGILFAVATDTATQPTPEQVEAG